MKRWLVAAALLGACGTHVSDKDQRRLRTAVGVAATELATGAAPARLQMIATELQATDPATQKLGQLDCLMLQTRAEALGREVAAIMPLLARDSSAMERTSADLTGAVQCLPGQPFLVGRVGKALREGSAAVQKALAESEHKGG
jgi:hypothetical protein